MSCAANWLTLAAADELKRRRAASGPHESLHQGQQRLDALLVPRARIALSAPRRWGKSEGSLRACVLRMRASSGRRFAWIAQTRAYAMEVARPVLEDLLPEVDPNLSRGMWELPNGSKIFIGGADSIQRQRFWRGLAWDGIVLEELQDWTTDVADFERNILRHSLTDRRGWMLVQGTPARRAKGYFHDAVHGEILDGIVYERAPTEPFENPYTAEQQKEEIAEARAIDPLVEQRAWYKREYLGEWVPDERALLYAPSGGMLKRGVPPLTRYVIGVDWGWTGSSAHIVCGWQDPGDKEVIFLRSDHGVKWTIEEHTARLGRLLAAFAPCEIVADPGGTSPAMTLDISRRTGVPIRNAEKTEKRANIELMNRDMRLGRIRIANDREPEAPEKNALYGAWQGIGEDEWEEHMDLADAALYAWRRSRHWLAREPKAPETEEERMRKHAEKLARARLKRQRRPI